MSIHRRTFLQISAALTTSSLLTGISSVGQNKPGLSSVSRNVPAIGTEERKARIAKAQQLMVAQNIEALILDAGTTNLDYFTGISWWASERPMVAIIPKKGEVRYVCPAFEESRFRELIKLGKEVYVWQEDESPYKQIVRSIQDAGSRSGSIAFDERLRYFIADGVKKEATGFNMVSGTPITMACRMIKTKAELALMQKANDITVASITEGIRGLHEGMTPGDINAIISRTTAQLGGSGGGGLILIAEASAYPHGTTTPKILKKGDIVLMDCGCEVEGYSADITRTIVFGAAPTKRQNEIWELEKASQLAGFMAAELGKPCENVDRAARKVIEDAGFGPGYKLPGLPHRTGHGIGMDGHEWGNMVKGNKQLLQTGMCFSIEPTIAIPGEFGVRLEDCIYMTEEGPKSFSPFSTAIDKPFGV